MGGAHLFHFHQVGHERGSGAGPEVEDNRPGQIQKIRIEEPMLFRRPDVVNDRIRGDLAEFSRFAGVAAQPGFNIA